ncbi:MAG: DnaJ domain-containing protein [Clostridia bacterium]|nr:DnaJ domain-containing protein [Clostridia bacterium]
MKIWEDYYHILQVHHDAEHEVIEGAYRRLCKKYHPDINCNAHAESKIKQINAAYEVLKDKEKRKDYHKQWLKNNKSTPLSSNTWKNGFGQPVDDAAQKILNTYIQALSNKNFVRAYEMLSNYNQKKVTKEDFVEWQEAVSKLYAIGHFETKVFKVHSDISLKHVACKKAIEFEIRMSEKNVQNGKISKYQFTKTTINENGNWKILLEYDDLKLLINKFKYLYHMNTQSSEIEQLSKLQIKKNELTGLLNQKGLLEELEKEKNRFLRYRNTFSIAVLSLRFPPKDEMVFVKKDIIKYAAYTIQQYIRNTDIVANITNDSFAIILTETNYESAKIAAENVCKILKDNFITYYNYKVVIRTGIQEHSGRDEVETLKTACYFAGVESHDQNEGYEDVRLEM